MALVQRHLAEPPAGPSRRQHVVAIAVLALVVLAAGFLAGRTNRRSDPAAGPVAGLGGVSLGVVHSRAGALAAACDYLLADQQSIEQNPGRFQALVTQAFAPSIQRELLGEAAAARAADPRGIALWASGGRSLTLVAARRLDYDNGDAAQITAWVGTIFWGPAQAPKQAWDLARTQLAWSDGRWLVTSMVTRLATAGPVPASTPQADPDNDTAAAFDRALAGFTAPGCGAPAS